MSLKTEIKEAIQLVVDDGGLDISKFPSSSWKEVASVAGCRLPWKILDIYKIDKTTYDMTNLFSESDTPVQMKKPLPVDLGAFFSDDTNVVEDEIVHAPLFKKTEPLPKKNISLDKYDDEFKIEHTPVHNMHGSVITVSTLDGYIYGICRTFETAWELKYRVIHDCGEGNFTIKQAEKEFMKKGFLVIRSENSQIKVVLENHPLLS